MSAADWPGLANGFTGPDPWVERDKLTAGQPAQITALAATFGKAARSASAGAAKGASASDLTGMAYQVDGSAVHLVDVETGKTRKLLGNSGEDMDRISKILGGVADELTTKTGTAVSQVKDLEAQLGTLQKTFDANRAAYLAARFQAQTNTGPYLGGSGWFAVAQLDQQFTAVANAFRDASADLVQKYGKQVGDLVQTYDDMLGGRSQELAALGFQVPAGVNEGPGDVDSDPDAGKRDAAAVADALKQQPGKQSLAEIDAASSEIRALNQKVANGGRLTDAERAYLAQFYNTLGPDALAKLPGAIHDGVYSPGNMAQTPPSAGQTVAAGQYDEALSPFQDSIMNLSQGKLDNTNAVRYEQDMPAAVQQLIDRSDLGVLDPDTGLRSANSRFLQPGDQKGGDPLNPGGYMIAGGVAGMDRYKGLAELLKSDIVPGKETAQHLADAAIRGKQQLNTIQDGARWSLANRVGGGVDGNTKALDDIIDDSASSDLLSSAARNTDASSDLLIDGQHRAQILGLNWEDNDGAVDVVNAGTNRDAATGGGTEQQARAALAVVTEVAHDRDGYLGRMDAPLERAVDHVGSDYMDAFAGSASNSTPSQVVHDRTDSLGRSLGPTFQLSQADRDHFLQFVAGTGKDPAADFQTAAKTWSQVDIGNVLAHGDTGRLNSALEKAGRLDGAITQANYDYMLDVTDGKDKAAAAQFASATELRAQQGAANVVAVVGKEILGAVVPGGKLVSPLLSIGTEAVKSAIGIHYVAPDPPVAQLPQTREDLVRNDSALANMHRDMMLAGAAQAAGLYDHDHPAPAILTADSDHDGHVDAPTSSSQNMDDLSGNVRSALDRWAVTHPEPESNGVVHTDLYGSGRDTSYSATWDGAGAPGDSAWSDDTKARELEYAPDPRPDNVFALPPTDPRVLDDPNYDRIRNRMRG